MNHQQLESDFVERFGRQPRLFRAPGRINIIGEHSDYNDGFVMPVNTALFTTLAIAPREDDVLRAHAVNFDSTQEISLGVIQYGNAEPWFEYVKGVAWSLSEAGHELCGADLLIHGGIPIGGGLSSSASLELVVGFALLTLAGVAIDRSRLAIACRRAESEFVGVNCGIMDQYVIALSDRNQAMKLDCRTLDYIQVHLPQGAAILVVDTGVKHQLSDGGFNARRQDCDDAAAWLGGQVDGAMALRDVTLEQLESCREQMDERLYRRARHVVTEQHRVHAVQAAMAANDLSAFGKLLNASHASLRDDFEVSCDELDALTDTARSTPGVYGSRMVGAGFGGCTISLVATDQMESATRRIVNEYAAQQGSEPWWHVCQAADPVGEVT